MLVCSYLGTDLKNGTASNIYCWETEDITAALLDQPHGVTENKISCVTIPLKDDDRNILTGY